MDKSPGPMLAQPVTGGCQCGAVRYALKSEPRRTHFCHCRMCQRAVGNVFAALTGVPKAHLTWTAGEPAFFASSSLARRGFCARCGTPLTFAYDDADWIYVTLGSLDQPARAKPERHFGVESMLPWLHVADELPRAATEANDKLRGMTVFQFQGLSHG